MRRRVTKRRGWVAFAASCAVACALAVACLPGTGAGLLDGADASGASTNLGGDADTPRADVDLGDPFAIEGVQPSHGPFTGGTRVRLTGRGFTSKLRVFLGDVEAAPGSLLASDPTRAALVTPPGKAGFVDVRIRDDATAQERVLPRGFLYDSLLVFPDSGATSGGTRVVVTGSGTAWTAGTTVDVAGTPCRDVIVTAKARLECVTPPGSPGAKDVTVTTPDGASVQARDAFTYSDSTDGYRGGLSGGAFAGRLRALAFDAMTGAPLAGAFAIAGSKLPGAIVQRTTATGVTEFAGLPGAKVTVTLAATCHQPITFVDVPVDTVTAYLSPVLDPACAQGDPPSTGGSGGRFGGVIEGQLLFPTSGEFPRAGWTTVPEPSRPTERRAAYVFEASASPSGTFALPPPAEAITPDSVSGGGFSYSITVFPGNSTIYAVAGLEDRSETPPRFMPYAMGVARGISVPPQTRVTGVDLAMDVLFDKRVTVAAQAPSPGPRGPDRLAATLAITLGPSAYAVVPRGQQITALPAPDTLPFVGVPALDHALAAEQYVLGAVAATGASLERPASVVTRVRTSNANDTVTLGGFVGVPMLREPGAAAWGGSHVEIASAGGAPVDLTVATIASGAGLVTWTLVAPGAATSFDVPDLASLPDGGNVGLRRGVIDTTVYHARIDDFSYGALRSGQLLTGAWNAYAFDTLSGAY